MSAFDQFDALLDSCQQQHFGEPMQVQGRTVTAIPDILVTFFNDVESSVEVFTVAIDQLNQRLNRGEAVRYKNQTYKIGRIHSDDGKNQVFQLEPTP